MAAYTDVRDFQKHLEAQGVAITTRTDPDSAGPAHITLSDPDGNEIKLDHHV